MTRRPLVLPALAAVVLTGCGGGATTDTLAPDQAVRAAAQATGDLASYRLAAVTEVDGEPVLRRDSVVGLDPPRSRTVTTVAETALAELRALPGVDQGTVRGSSEERLVDGVRYVSDPESGGWLSYPSSQRPGSTFDGPDLLSRLAEADGVERLGRERVRGVETTRYRGEFGTAEISLPIEAWIDDDGLTRRLRVPGPGDPENTTTTTLELYDVGTDVDVEAPPAGQVRQEGPDR